MFQDEELHVPAIDACSEVIFMNLLSLLSRKFGRKYLLTRNGPSMCELKTDCETCFTYLRS